jgi:hypothetical protein
MERNRQGIAEPTRRFPAGRADLLFFFNQVPRKDPGSELLADAVKLKIKVNVRNLVHKAGVVIQIQISQR